MPTNDERHEIESIVSFLSGIFATADPDALIVFGRNVAEGQTDPRTLAAIRVAKLSTEGAALVRYAVTNRRRERRPYFFIVNAFRPSLSLPMSVALAELLAATMPVHIAQSAIDVHQLTDIPVDFDRRNGANSSLDDLVGRLYDACSDGALPWPSAVIDSGRGLHLHYALAAIERTEASVWLRARIFDEICRRAATLHADFRPDRVVRSLNRFMKLPGSYACNPVGDLVRVALRPFPSIGGVEPYTLDQLGELLGLDDSDLNGEMTPLSSAGGEIVARVPRHFDVAPKRRRVRAGQGSQPRIKRAHEIELLAELRGGFVEGMRHLTLWHYAQAVYFASRYQGCDRALAATWRKVRELNRTCRPPLGESELRKVMVFDPKPRAAGAPKVHTARNETISEIVRITAEEVRQIETKNDIVMKCLLPIEMRRYRADLDQRSKNANKARRALVDRLLREGLPDAAVARTAVAARLEVSRQYVSQRRKKLDAPAAWTPLAPCHSAPAAGSSDIKFLT